MILDETSKCVTDITEKVFFCYINKSFDRSAECVNKETVEKIIRDCASGAWKVAKKRQKHIKYVFAMYHAKVVGVFKVKGETIHRSDLADRYALNGENTEKNNILFPEYPPKRKKEYRYSIELKNCVTKKQIESKLKSLNNELSYNDFSKNILEGQKYKNWKNTYFFEFDDDANISEELKAFMGKILLFPIPKGNDSLCKYRKIYQNEHYNFDENGDLKNYI